MRVHISNALYGVLDWAAYPVGMLMVAPLMLHKLGPAQYGVWAVATAAVSTGSIIASGFGDANIQHVAAERGAGNTGKLGDAVRATMGIHLVLGGIVALAAWMLAPNITHHVVRSDLRLFAPCLWSLRIASLLMLVRAVETVCISTQRAFEKYGAAVHTSILFRLLSLGATAVLTFMARGVISVMAATAILITLGVGMQLQHLRRLLGAESLLPVFDSVTLRALLSFGLFSWIQAVSGILIGQADRLVIGISMGATNVAAYALCVQLAQPIYGVASSALHFFFPYLSAQHPNAALPALRRSVFFALTANLLLVAGLTTGLLVVGPFVIHRWAGPSVAHGADLVFPVVVWSTAVLASSVTAYYALLGLNRVRAATLINLSGGVIMMAAILWLLPRSGMFGVAWARFVYGAVALLMYVPLIRLLRGHRPARSLSEPGLFQAGTHANVLGILVEALDMERSLVRVEEALRSSGKGYVCAIGVHGIMEAHRNRRFAEICAGASIAVPDGMPLVWVGRMQGCRGMRRVAGPDLMLEVFRRKEFAGYTHFLYGGKPGVAEELSANLKRKFPSTRILGTYTPPFRDLTPSEAADFIGKIHDLKPDVIWVGISTPRQEEFIYRYLPSLDTKLMFGVGAAFDFHTGRIRDCPQWAKQAGLQWLHRLLQDPRRLWLRYLRNNSAFLLQMCLQLAGMHRYSNAAANNKRDQAPDRLHARPASFPEAEPDI